MAQARDLSSMVVAGKDEDWHLVPAQTSALPLTGAVAPGNWFCWTSQLLLLYKCR